MSQTNLCRLCVKVCTDYASLYNETGQKNNICEITLKYFDPMFLNANQVPGSAVLCLECCGHISVFYEFQQTVFQAQRRIRKGEREIEFEFKKEISEELILDNSNVTVKQDDSISLPDLELAEEFMFEDNFQNEDIQVNSQTVFEPIQQCENTEEEKDTEQSKDQQLSTYDTWEKGSDSDENQPTTRMKRKRKQNADEPIPLCENTEEFGDKDDKITFNNLGTKQLQDKPLPTSDTSESENSSGSDYIQPKTRMKLKRTQKSLLVDLDAVKCKLCDSYFSSVSCIHEHMRLVHFTANIETSDKIGISKLSSKSSIECVLCKTSYAKFSVLKDHYRLEHPTEVCYALCCERKFKRACVFEDHMRLHRDPNAFKCEICGKRLGRSDALREHMRLHRDPNAFKCEICDRRMGGSDALRVHMRMHRHPNAFTCKICGKRMCRSDALKDHMQLHRDPNAFILDIE